VTVTKHEPVTIQTDLTWDSFVGQERAKRQLQRAAGAAKIRGARMPHTLLAAGAPGIGKTSLAMLIAKEMGTKLRIISGRVSVGEVRLTLSGMDDHDILLIDEIHTVFSGNKRNGEWLLHLLENGVILGPRGPEEQPDITVIGTTTDAGILPDTILDRFPASARPPLVGYNDEEAAQIAMTMAERIIEPPIPLPTPGNCAAIALAANNNPRVIRGLVEALRDSIYFYRVENFISDEEGYALDEVFEDAGVTPDGLTELAVRYLVVMLDEFRGEPAGAGAMKERLREQSGLASTERLLADKGYLAFTKRGRDLTQAGMKRARTLRGL
jgi:Holliday junction DNA helicase RuvB